MENFRLLLACPKKYEKYAYVCYALIYRAPWFPTQTFAGRNLFLLANYSTGNQSNFNRYSDKCSLQFLNMYRKQNDTLHISKYLMRTSSIIYDFLSHLKNKGIYYLFSHFLLWVCLWRWQKERCEIEEMQHNLLIRVSWNVLWQWQATLLVLKIMWVCIEKKSPIKQ